MFIYDIFLEVYLNFCPWKAVELGRDVGDINDN